MRPLPIVTMIAALILNGFALRAQTASPDTDRLVRLEQRVSKVESDLKHAGDTGLVLILFGAFCALWAQNTGRNAWLWFFLGLFFSAITILFLLTKNADDRMVRQWRERLNQESP